MKGYTIQHSIDLLEKSVENLEARPSGGGSAADVSYDNTSSGLTADDVQDAIDELNSDISTVNSKLVGWGTPVVATAEELAAFDTATDTYTAPATGLLIIDVRPSQNAENYLYVSKGDLSFKGSSSIGDNYEIVIPVTQGDVLTVTTILKCAPASIVTFPFALAAPVVASTRTKKKK